MTCPGPDCPIGPDQYKSASMAAPNQTQVNVAELFLKASATPEAHAYALLILAQTAHTNARLVEHDNAYLSRKLDDLVTRLSEDAIHISHSLSRNPERLKEFVRDNLKLVSKEDLLKAAQ